MRMRMDSRQIPSFRSYIEVNYKFTLAKLRWSKGFQCRLIPLPFRCCSTCICHRGYPLGLYNLLHSLEQAVAFFSSSALSQKYNQPSSSSHQNGLAGARNHCHHYGHHRHHIIIIIIIFFIIFFIITLSFLSTRKKKDQKKKKRKRKKKKKDNFYLNFAFAF